MCSLCQNYSGFLTETFSTHVALFDKGKFGWKKLQSASQISGFGLMEFSS
jgi:hypothetical protein